MSNVHRLRLTDESFFVNVNLRPGIRRFNDSEYALLIEVLEASRRRLGFLLCGYVLMPDHWHGRIWPQSPLLLWQVLHDAKKIMTLRLHARQGTQGPLWQHQFWDRFVRHEKEFNERLVYAPESRQEKVGEAGGGLAPVELQQLCFGQGNGGGVPDSD